MKVFGARTFYHSPLDLILKLSAGNCRAGHTFRLESAGRVKTFHFSIAEMFQSSLHSVGDGSLIGSPAKRNERFGGGIKMSTDFRKTLMAVVIATLSFSVIACSSSLEGKYTNGTGMVVIEFSTDKAFVTVGALTAEGSYKIDGDQVIIEAEDEKIVLTRNSDGSLSGPKDSFIGRLTKQKT